MQEASPVAEPVRELGIEFFQIQAGSYSFARLAIAFAAAFCNNRARSGGISIFTPERRVSVDGSPIGDRLNNCP